jgi:hypothetical protein
MGKHMIQDLIRSLKGVEVLELARVAQAADALRRVFTMTPDPATGGPDPVHQLLHMADVCLPGWTIQLTGKASEPDGHWRCCLRQTRVSDEVEVIGLGAGRVVELALLEALLHVAEQKAVN